MAAGQNWLLLDNNIDGDTGLQRPPEKASQVANHVLLRRVTGLIDVVVSHSGKDHVLSHAFGLMSQLTLADALLLAS